MKGTDVSEKINESHHQVTADTLMTTKVYSVTSEMTISQAIGLLLIHRVRGAPVVDTLTKVMSVITEADLMKLAVSKGLSKTVGSCLEDLPKFENLVTAKKTAPFSTLYREFLTNSVQRIIVVDDTRRLLGLVCRSDILKLLYSPKNELPATESETESVPATSRISKS
jgi:CBS-domain-containing membrane protein